jgi:hypothetical protein
MSGVYPVFEHHIPGMQMEWEMSGKTLIWSSDALEALAQQRGLPTLSSYFSSCPLSPRTDAGSGEEPQDSAAGDWHDPQEGLRTVQGLRDCVEQNPNWVYQQDWAWDKPEAAIWVVEDLGDIERILLVAQQYGTRFHLTLHSEA